MARTALPVTASLFLALFGLPAMAAEIGDETSSAADEAAATDVAGAEQAVASPAQGSERAARKGGGRSSGRAAASAPRGQQGRAPAAGGPRAQAPQAQRPAAASPQRGGQPAHTQGNASAQREQGSSSQRPGGQGGQSGQSGHPGQGSQGGQSGHPGNGGGASQQHGGPQAHNTAPGNRPGANHPGASQPGSNHPGANHPGSGHPGNAHSGGSNGHARPGAKPNRHVIHHSAYVPARWAPSWHRYHLRGVPHASPRYWAAGVFYYNPPPRGHRVVIVDEGGKRVEDATGPQRAVNRNNSFSVSLQGGSYMSGYRNGGGYGDLGLGLELGYRPVEALGLELSWMHHSDTWDDHAERAQDPISASVELFAFPWTRVSPYLDVGLTATPRAARDTYFNGLENVTYEANDALFGPHIGAGIEFAVGQRASLDFSGKYIGYIDVQQGDTALPAAFQGQMGLNMYF